MRWGEHVFDARHGGGYYLHRAMRKYGIENFEFKVIIRNIPEDKLDYYECLWIKKLNTMNRNMGYNLVPGGSVQRGPDNPMYGKTPWNKGVPRTPEEKLRMSMAHKKYREAKSKRMSGKNNPMYGHVYTDEERREMSCRATGEKNGFYGKHHSDETKQILKQSNKHSFRPVDMIDLKTGEVIKSFECVRDAVRYLNELLNKTNVDHSFISRCAAGKHKVAYGFGWRFSERCND